MRICITSFIVGVAFLFVPNDALAHCDTLDGPVVSDARLALMKSDLAPVLKWLMPEHESETRSVFQETLAVRGLSPDARQLADRYFFETVVRLHRLGEGAPYTGLKPPGTKPDRTDAAADAALKSGTVDQLVTQTLSEIENEIRHRFDKVLHAKQHANQTVEEGRAYVEAYVDFVHYVKRLDQQISMTTVGHAQGSHDSEHTHAEHHGQHDSNATVHR